MAATRRFAADAGHELRTPLTGLRANLDALERNPDLPEAERAALLREMTAEQDRIVHLLDGLQALARGEAADASRARTSSSATSSTPPSTARAAATRRRLRARRARSSEATVHGWANGLRLVVDNLLENAALHGRRRAGPRRTRARGRPPAAARRGRRAGHPRGGARAAARAVRARARDDRPGTGLGLAIVAQQVGSTAACCGSATPSSAGWRSRAASPHTDRSVARFRPCPFGQRALGSVLRLHARTQPATRAGARGDAGVAAAPSAVGAAPMGAFSAPMAASVRAFSSGRAGMPSGLAPRTSPRCSAPPATRSWPAWSRRRCSSRGSPRRRRRPRRPVSPARRGRARDGAAAARRADAEPADRSEPVERHQLGVAVRGRDPEHGPQLPRDRAAVPGLGPAGRRRRRPDERQAGLQPDPGPGRARDQGVHGRPARGRDPQQRPRPRHLRRPAGAGHRDGVRRRRRGRRGHDPAQRAAARHQGRRRQRAVPGRLRAHLRRPVPLDEGAARPGRRRLARRLGRDGRQLRGEPRRRPRSPASSTSSTSPARASRTRGRSSRARGRSRASSTPRSSSRA